MVRPQPQADGSFRAAKTGTRYCGIHVKRAIDRVPATSRPKGSSKPNKSISYNFHCVRLQSSLLETCNGRKFGSPLRNPCGPGLDFRTPLSPRISDVGELRLLSPQYARHRCIRLKTWLTTSNPQWVMAPLATFPFLTPAEFESACRALADRARSSAQRAEVWSPRLVTQVNPTIPYQPPTWHMHDLYMKFGNLEELAHQNVGG